MESIQKVINENLDSLEIGMPAKGGSIKVYGSFADLSTFEAKLIKDFELRKKAKDHINLKLLRCVYCKERIGIKTPICPYCYTVQ